MSPESREFTPAEAAVLSGVNVKAVHNAIDKRVVYARGSDLAAKARRLSHADLLRLKLWYSVGEVLSADRREQLFAGLAFAPAAKTVRADPFIIVDIAAARRQLAVRIRQLERAEALVHVDPAILGGEPVFRGTRVPVRMVAAMLTQGATAEEIAEGYPSLKPMMIELAPIWSAAHPARGRPRRGTSSWQLIASKRVPLNKHAGASGPSARS